MNSLTTAFSAVIDSMAQALDFQGAASARRRKHRIEMRRRIAARREADFKNALQLLRQAEERFAVPTSPHPQSLQFLSPDLKALRSDWATVTQDMRQAAKILNSELHTNSPLHAASALPRLKTGRSAENAKIRTEEEQDMAPALSVW